MMNRGRSRRDRRAQPEGSDRGRVRWWSGPFALVASGLVMVAVFGPACDAWGQEEPDPASSTSTLRASTKPVPHGREKTYIKRTWGIEILFVRQTSAGYMLEFRYKVVDAEKAKPLFERRTKPVLTDAATGAKLAVPTPAKTGALRNSDTPIEGRTYWMVFANPGGLVKQGNLVSIEIGDFRIDDLVVQ